MLSLMAFEPDLRSQLAIVALAAQRTVGLGDIVPKAAGSDAAECEHHDRAGQDASLVWIDHSSRGLPSRGMGDRK